MNWVSLRKLSWAMSSARRNVDTFQTTGIEWIELRKQKDSCDFPFSSILLIFEIVCCVTSVTLSDYSVWMLVIKSDIKIVSLYQAVIVYIQEILFFRSSM